MLALRQIHLGHCLDLLRQMPDESVNCVVTSPPYWRLRDYGIAPTPWGGDPKHAHVWGEPMVKTAGGGQPGEKRRWQHSGGGTSGHPRAAAGSLCSCGAWLGCLGLEPTPFQFVEHMIEVFRETRRVLRADGTLWLNLGDSYATGADKVGDHPGGGEQGARWKGEITRVRDNKRGYRGERLPNGRGDSPAILRKKTRADRDGTHAGKHTAIAAMGPMTQPNRMPIPGLKPKDLIGVPWRVAFALQADGWWLRSDIVWAKPNPMPESVTDRPTKAHEYMFLLSKSEKYSYDAAAIREPQQASEASTPDDRARAFSRRRQTTIEPRQGEVESEDLPGYRAGNKERVRRDGNGGVFGHTSHQAFGVPWADTDGLRNKRSVWTVATEPYGGAHFATFPKKLVEPAILAGCPSGGVVLDPFGGSGTVGEVAEALGRNWIAFDLNPSYIDLARKRTAQRGLFVEVGTGIARPTDRPTDRPTRRGPHRSARRPPHRAPGGGVNR